MKEKILLVAVFASVLPAATAQSVGAAPGSIDLGTVERGETETFEIYFTVTGTNNPFNLNLNYQEPLRGPILEGSTIVNPREYSAQDIGSWIQFSEESYRIDPKTEEEYTLPDGSVVNAQGVAKIRLKVPEDAQPGYHAGQISINPDFSGGQGFGTRVVGVARPSFYFEVPGEVTKNLEVTRVDSIRTGEDTSQLVMTVRNTGSITTTLTGGEINILDSSGSKIGWTSLPARAQIPPGESRRIEAIWASDKVEGGNFQFEGDLSYRTGNVFVSGSFSLSGAPQEPIDVQDPEDQPTGDEESQKPWLLVLLALIVLGVLMYYVGLEIYIIFLVEIISGIVAFLLLNGTGVIILLVMAALGLLIYYLM